MVSTFSTENEGNGVREYGPGKLRPGGEAETGSFSLGMGAAAESTRENKRTVPTRPAREERYMVGSDSRITSHCRDSLYVLWTHTHQAHRASPFATLTQHAVPSAIFSV